MMVTIEEAKTTICPILKEEDGDFQRCRHVYCMMWRRNQQSLEDKVVTGYCGLAGKPEGWE